MGFVDSFINSLRLPKKEAMFHLNRKGIIHTILYVFLLLVVLFLPDLIRMLLNLEASADEGTSRGLLIIQVLVFYPGFVIFMILVSVSIFAGCGLLMRTWLNRKLTYQQLWKLTVYAATTPLIIVTVLNMTPLNEWMVALLFISTLLFLLLRMIQIYPKRTS
ncbi:DUF1189 family protein [Thalassobacillus sp. CUG 92003]|uniref:DUF1189 family protein n=1 Tax=Thalassobacillus sp. CUG 92003 TaxID=2736641 RepID=UPI0015E73C84|nr:DUF1189 family protein [Thalassobacillus sp. CUG 92003]